MRKKSDDEAVKEDLGAGIDAAERCLKKANEAVDRDLLDEALEELVGRVDDWKNHRVEHFGKLLLHGMYTVVTGKTDQERDYEIYLFECILLCCKEITPNKSKEKKDKTKSTLPTKTRNKNNKLQLKGRIFMTNVTEVLSFSKPGKLVLLLERLTFCCQIIPLEACSPHSNVYRLLHCADLVERGSWCRELRHQVPERGNDEEMGRRLGQPKKGERASKCYEPRHSNCEFQVDGSPG